MRGANMPQRMQTVANSISQHISNVTFEKIRPNRMVLNFKLDKHENLMLLWCSSLRIEGNKIKQKQNKAYEFIPRNQSLNAIPLKIEHKPHVRE